MLYWIAALNAKWGNLKKLSKKLESEFKDFPLDKDKLQKWNDVPSEISSM